MTPKIIKSVVNLFALTANKQDNLDIEIYIKAFTSFLTKTVESQYCQLYEKEFIQALDVFSTQDKNKKLALNSVRIIKLCNETAENLSMPERYEIVFYLLTLLKSVNNKTSVSFDFVELIADMFNIATSCFKQLCDFIFEKENDNFVYLKIENEIIVRLFYSQYELVLVQSKSDFLKVNNVYVVDNEFAICKNDSVLKYRELTKFFYPDLKYEATKHQKQIHNNFNLIINDLDLIKSNKTLLHKLNINIKSGELIGIIGNSGSGKTSLLNAIANYKTCSANSIYLQYSDGISNKLNLGFVEQFQQFIPEYSVREHLERRVELLQVPILKQKHIIDEVLSSVQLTDDENKIAVNQDNFPKQISGGQLKRLGIATELLAEPQILLLDEPTSGLSSLDALVIINLLKNVAKTNKIVITSVHQPDFNMFMSFDKILIIDDGGFPIYFDTPTKSVDYFRKITNKIDNNTLLEEGFNPAVLFNLIAETKNDKLGNKTKNRIIKAEEWYELFVNNNKNNFRGNDENIDNNNNITNHFSKLKYFCAELKFSFKTDIKQKLKFLLLFCVPLLASISFSLIVRYSPKQDYYFYDNPNIPVWMLIILVTAIFIGLVSSAHEFIYLRKLHIAELKLLKLKANTLLIAKIVKYVFIAFIQAVALTLPALFIVSAEFHFVYFTLLVFLLIFNSSMIGILLSLLFKNQSIVYLVIPLIIIPQMLFSGAMIKYNELNKTINAGDKVPVIVNFIPLYWAVEAGMTRFFICNKYEQKYYNLNTQLYDAVFNLNYFILTLQDIYAKNNLLADKIIDDKIMEIKLVTNNIDTSFEYKLELVKKYYADYKNYIINKKDSLLTDDEIYQKLKYTNSQINNIINSQNLLQPIQLVDNKLIRKYKINYNLPAEHVSNRYFLTNIKKCFNTYIYTYYFNLIMISILTFFVIGLSYICLRKIK